MYVVIEVDGSGGHKGLMSECVCVCVQRKEREREKVLQPQEIHTKTVTNNQAR